MPSGPAPSLAERAGSFFQRKRAARDHVRGRQCRSWPAMNGNRNSRTRPAIIAENPSYSSEKSTPGLLNGVAAIHDNRCDRGGDGLLRLESGGVMTSSRSRRSSHACCSGWCREKGPSQALGHPAVITVACVLILSRGALDQRCGRLDCAQGQCRRMRGLER